MTTTRTFFTCIIILLFATTVEAQYAEYDWADRDTWMDVNAIFDTIGIKNGDAVADIGCHEGYLSVRLAKRVTAKGKVYAVDVRNDRLKALKENLKDRKLTNVEVILGDYDNPKLPKNSLDVVIIMDTYHEMDDYLAILKHVHTALKPKGKLVIIEKLKSRIKGKSRASQVAAHSLGPTYVRKEMVAAGFKLLHQNNNMGDWENDTTKVIWMLIAEK